MSKFVDGTFTDLAEPVSFKVKSLNNAVLQAEDRADLAKFQNEVNELARVVYGAQNSMSEMSNELTHIKEAITASSVSQKELMKAYLEFDQKLTEISTGINGDAVATKLDIDKPWSVASRIGNIQYDMYYSTSKPTKTHRESLKIANEEFQPLLTSLRKLIREDLVKLQAMLEDANAPYTPNRVMVP